MLTLNPPLLDRKAFFLRWTQCALPSGGFLFLEVA
jgi:hypothetical protein